MLVLALDTSAEIAVSVVRDDLVLAARRVGEQRRHAELLAPMVVEALSAAGVDRRELDAVVVGTGPAPFTGLRAGLVTARTLAWALGVPALGVCSLDAWALQAVRAGLVADGDQVVVVTDARRREVYTARYVVSQGTPHLLEGPAVTDPALLAAEVADRGGVVVGAGAVPPGPPPVADGPTALDPAALAALAVVRAGAGVDQPSEPLYLRRPDVTPSAGRKRATG